MKNGVFGRVMSVFGDSPTDDRGTHAGKKGPL